MRDGDVRTALHHLLRDQHAPELDRTQFVDELGLCGQVRVDVAVINGELAGYELKSERDTLRRLPIQVEVYSRVLDRAVLVAAPRHAEHARALLPEWWGVLLAQPNGTDLQLGWFRPADLNPRIDPEALVQLLWRDEAIAELERRGLDVGIRSKSRKVIWSRLAERVPLQELRATVRERLKQRAAWPTGS